MSLALFTRRTSEPSTRLRLLARGFQYSGIITAAVMAGLLLSLPFFTDHAHTPRILFAPTIEFIGFVFLTAASSFLIGRALLQKQRWGAYLAGVTLGVPLVRQLLSPDANILSVNALALYTVALCVTVTVWDELGTVRDADFEEEDDDVVPQRNRGFGEPRNLPSASTPNTFAKQNNDNEQRVSPPASQSTSE